MNRKVGERILEQKDFVGVLQASVLDSVEKCERMIRHLHQEKQETSEVMIDLNAVI